MAEDPITSSGRDRITRVDLSTYGLNAVLKSSYRFTGRCFIHLQREGNEMMEVRMRPKSERDDPDTAIRDFLNDLIDQQLRTIVAAETTDTRNLIMAHALSRTTFIRPESETVEPTQDPENVSTPDRRRVAAP